MGACDFMVESNGDGPQKAFNNAVDDALYDYGHNGYTGSIAEKSSFVMIDLPKGEDPFAYARDLIDNSDDRIDDKWGPAGCIHVKDNTYLFFGWASS